MNLSDFRIVICYSFSGDFEDYKIFSNIKAANEFRDLYNEKYGPEYYANVDPLQVYDTVMEEKKKIGKVFFMSDV